MVLMSDVEYDDNYHSHHKIVINAPVMGLRGGGKVIKKIIKTKSTETTVQSDGVFFEQSFKAALAIHSFTDISIKDSLLKMDLDKLKALYVCLKHDKSVVAKKVERLCEFLPEGIALEKAQHKINSAMYRLRNMTITSMEQEDGSYDIKVLLEHKVFRAQQELVLKALKVLKVPLEHKDFKVFRVQQELERKVL
jgi:hypothetical protein